MKTLYYLIILLPLLFVGCKTIDKDPVKGANDLYIQLTKYASSNNLDEAHEELSRYWNTYDDNNRKIFLFTLRGNLLTDDKVVNFIVEPSFVTYPMCGAYMKAILDLAHQDALNSPSTSPASKGIIFGSLLSDYAETNNILEAEELITSTLKNLQRSTELTRNEFFDSFGRFIKNSGDPGIRAYQFMQHLESKDWYSFMRLSLESTLDFER